MAGPFIIKKYERYKNIFQQCYQGYSNKWTANINECVRWANLQVAQEELKKLKHFYKNTDYVWLVGPRGGQYDS